MLILTIAANIYMKIQYLPFKCGVELLSSIKWKNTTLLLLSTTASFVYLWDAMYSLHSTILILYP